MGLERRKQSGNLIGGSTLIVPGSPIYSTKRFETSFSFKRGSKPDIGHNGKIPVTPPVTTTTTTEQIILDALLVDNNTYSIIGVDEYLKYIE